MTRQLKPLLVAAALLAGSGAGAPVAQAADDCPNAAVRAAQSSQHLPDCRAYELVSPADKSAGAITYPSGVEGYQVMQTTLNAARPDGNAALFVSYAPFSNPRGGLINSYRARRAADGWHTDAWSPQTIVKTPELFDDVRVRGTDANFDVAYLQTNQPYDPLDTDDPSFGAGLDVYRLAADGKPQWLSRPPSAVADADPSASAFAGTSSDGKDVLFETADSVIGAPWGQVGGGSLYRETAGHLEMVSAPSPGNIPVSTCGSVLATHNANPNGGSYPVDMPSQSPATGAIVKNSRQVFFTAPDPNAWRVSSEPACNEPAQLYLRDGNNIIKISRSRRAVPDTPKTAWFQNASSDGKTVYFISDEALTDDAPQGLFGLLYRYDVQADSLKLLSPMADVIGVSAASSDGRIVYYVQRRDAATFALMRYGPGGTSVVAADVGDGGSAPRLTGWAPEAKVSSDGSRLVFSSDHKLTAYDNRGVRELYLFSASTETTTCISCSPSGAPPIGPAALVSDAAAGGLITVPGWRNVSADGSRIFFESPEALVLRDDNSAMDVYQWADGQVTLISDGRAKRGSYFFDADESGDSVFFATAASLVSQDIDNGDQDIYVSRVGGGFNAATAPPAACQTDQCQGALTRSAPPKVAGSVTFRGSDRGPLDRVPVRSSVTISQTKTVVGAAAKLKVKVPAGGTIGLSGSSVRTVTRKVSKAATYSVTASLTASARSTLRKRKSLKVSVRVSFTPKTGSVASKKVVVAFKQPASKGGR